MPYALTFITKPTYLHAVVTGENGRETVLRYLDEVRRECVARGCRRVLIEERLVGPRIDLLDVIQVASEGSRRALGTLQAIAFVDVNAEGDGMKLAETVAASRWLPVRVFPAVDAAARWLEGAESPGGAPGAR
jgi:hypothetical protein